MNRFTSFIITVFLLAFASLAMPMQVYAQVDPDLENLTSETTTDTTNEEEKSTDLTGSGVPDDFTGTLSDQDPQSPNYIDPKLFGSNEALPEDDEEDDLRNFATHKLIYESEFQVLTTDLKTELTYLEVNYTARFELLTQVRNRRFRGKANVEIFTDVVGNLFSNELVQCNLDIEIDDKEIDALVYHNIIPETDEEDAKSQLAIQLKFVEKILEKWTSKCLGVDGTIFDTVGDLENYFDLAFNALLPNPKALVYEDYDKFDTAVIDLEVDPFIIEGAIEEQLVTGLATVTVEELPEPVDLTDIGAEDETTEESSEEITEETPDVFTEPPPSEPTE